jgi:hypothetical protein
LQKAVENMKQKGAGLEGIKDHDNIFRKDDIDLLSNYKIPTTLDFRILSLKLNHQHLLNDLVEKG